MLKEFKEFALKGSLLDTAIAFVMGAAFGKVVSAFVEKMFSPIVGLLMGGTNLSDKEYILREAVVEVKDAAGIITTAASPKLAIGWGHFITVGIDFIVVAFVMFLIIKGINKMKKEAPAEAPAPSPSETLLQEILDELKKGK